MEKQKFKIVDKYFNDGNGLIPVEWNKFNDEIINSIPSDSLFNITAFTEKGELMEKTVIFLYPVDKLNEKSNTVIELNDIIVGIPK